MSVEENEDEIDWEEDGEERVEEDLSLEGKVRGQDEVRDVPLPCLHWQRCRRG